MLSRTSSMVRWGLAAMSLAMVVGCGGGASDDKATAKVTGKVTQNGAPVSGGELVFSPVAESGSNKPPGQSGRAPVKSDGTFTVTTYKDGDGAVVGQHRVMYLPPSAPPVTHDEKGQPVGEQKAPEKLAPSKESYTVAKGENKIDIELVAAPK